MLSDKENPNYRNSIKESISAVEAICKNLTGNKRATLNTALKKLDENGIVLHGAFQKSISELYGYTSDAGGIRHCLMNDYDADFADAKYMLMVCSAFCSFLLEKSRKL